MASPDARNSLQGNASVGGVERRRGYLSAFWMAELMDLFGRAARDYSRDVMHGGRGRGGGGDGRRSFPGGEEQALDPGDVKHPKEHGDGA